MNVCNMYWADLQIWMQFVRQSKRPLNIWSQPFRAVWVSLCVSLSLKNDEANLKNNPRSSIQVKKANSKNTSFRSFNTQLSTQDRALLGFSYHPLVTILYQESHCIWIFGFFWRFKLVRETYNRVTHWAVLVARDGISQNSLASYFTCGF